MAVNQQKFKDLALKLKIKFADFFISREFKILGPVSPLGGSSANNDVQLIFCLREEYDIKQKDNQLIQLNDFKLLVLNEAWVAAYPSNITPNVDGLQVTVDDKICNVVNATTDPATAMWTLQVRG